MVAGLTVATFLAGFALQGWMGGGEAVGGTVTDTRAPLAPHQGESAPDSSADGRGAVPAGPVRTAQGVPAGFSRSERGAVAAAEAYVGTGQTLLDMDPLAAEKALRQMATTDSAEEQVDRVLDRLSQVRQVLAYGSGPIVFRQGVIAWRVDSYSAERVRVAVWHVGVLSREGAAPPQAGWATSTVELVWERDDWKIAEESVVPGPAPILNDSVAPATATLLQTALDGFTDFGSGR
jgi:hypothetical protein